jgi:hypothetical protein
MKTPRNIAGFKHPQGKLTAIKIDHINPKYGAVWLCDCDCGNEHLVLSSQLVSNRVKSCGCIQREKRKASAERITAFNETKTILQWAQDPRCSVGVRRLRIRLAVGWGEEEAITRAAHGGLRPKTQGTRRKKTNISLGELVRMAKQQQVSA